MNCKYLTRKPVEYVSWGDALDIFFKDTISLQASLAAKSDEDVLKMLKNCIECEWNEGVLICEKEIEHRGLHVDNPKERFEL